MNRRILVSLMVIGLAGAALGSTTMAMFSDSETSHDNVFTAGELDLLIDWEEYYNGEHIETQELTNDPGAIFHLKDVKPGDKGKAVISLHLEDNPGWIWMNMVQTANENLNCPEPQQKALGVDSAEECPEEGHLGEYLEFTVYTTDASGKLHDDSHIIFQGTADELEEKSFAEGVLLDGDSTTTDAEAFPGGETSYVGVKWNVPLETGNIIQGDSKKFDISFYTEQRRHNDNPKNPWAPVDKEPEPENEYYQVDFVEGQPIEDLSESTYSSEQRMQRYAHGGPGNPVDNETESDQVFTASGGPDCVDSEAFLIDLDKDTMSVVFDVHDKSDCKNIELTFVSYEKPHAGWIAEKADEQKIFDSDTQKFMPGTHCMTVDIPDVNDGESDYLSSCADLEVENGDENGAEECEMSVDPEMEYTADEISQAKYYGYDFDELSGVTMCAVADLFNNQPFAEGLTLEDLMTKNEISQDMFDKDFDELSSDSQADVEQDYNDQFAAE